MGRVLSEPCEVYWAGWRTTTDTLQRHGWQISAEEVPFERRVRIALHHPNMSLYGVSDWTEYHYQTQEHMRQLMPRLNIRHVAPNLQCQITEVDDWNNFQAVDAAPRYIEHRIESMEDMKIFAPCQNRQEEVYIEQADMSVVDHLAAIKELQAPKQAELRHKARRDDKRQAADSEIIMQIIKVA